MMTDNETIIKDVQKYGPAEASKFHKLRFPGLVETLTGISWKYGSDTIIEETNSKEAVYHQAGLAIHPFPTFWHKEVAKARKLVSEIYDEIHSNLNSLNKKWNDADLNLEERIIARAARKKWEILKKDMDIRYDRGTFHRNAHGAKETPTYNPNTYASLMIQYQEGDTIREVYSYGGFSSSIKAWRPHNYIYFNYNSGNGKRIPYSPLQVMARSLKPLRLLLALGTLSASEMVIDSVKYLFNPKGLLEKKMLGIAQKNWEANQKSLVKDPIKL